MGGLRIDAHDVTAVGTSVPVLTGVAVAGPLDEVGVGTLRGVVGARDIDILLGVADTVRHADCPGVVSGQVEVQLLDGACSGSAVLPELIEVNLHALLHILILIADEEVEIVLAEEGISASLVGQLYNDFEGVGFGRLSLTGIDQF